MSTADRLIQKPAPTALKAPGDADAAGRSVGARSTVVVSIIVPTLGRPDSLARALASVLGQEIGSPAELIVVDNDPAGSARAVCEGLAAGSPLPLRYVSAPAPGVSNARNAGVGAARGDFIAFLDDDQSAPPHWLDALLAAQTAYSADVVFGPVRASLPPAVTGHRAFLERFFGRAGPEESGPIQTYYGCGNCLIRRSALPDPVAPFSPKRNRVGGEDDLLFSAMQAAGARFAWASDAWVLEHVPPARARLTYVLARAFAYGQGPSSTCAAAGPRRWPMIPVWMAIGVGQAAIYGAIALGQGLARQENAAMLDRAAQGAGKVLWFTPFKIGFYGRVPRPE